MSTLMQRIASFEAQEQRFADLLNLTVNELRELKEVDDPTGWALYTAWYNFDRGIYPTKEFIAQYTDRAAQ